MRIDHGCPRTRVTQHLLNRPDVVALLMEMNGKRMSQLAGLFILDMGRAILHRPLHDRSRSCKYENLRRGHVLLFWVTC